MTTISMKERTRIGLWNVRTMNESSRLAQIEQIAKNYRIEIMGMCETRWNGYGETRTRDGYTMFYSGKEDLASTRERGVGLLLSPDARKSLTDWKPVSERILTATFATRVRKMTIVVCYSPTNTSEAEEKEAFYSKLAQTFSSIQKGHIKLLIGDLNAKIGGDNSGLEKHLGKHGLGDRNENGDLFVDFCMQHNLVIGGSLFPHKTCHKETWVSPDGKTKNQIDHVAISSSWRGSLLDVRNRRGADIDSDHYLVIAQIRLKIASALKRTQKVSKHFNTRKLQTQSVRTQYIEAIQRGVDTKKMEESPVADAWEHYKSAVHSANEQLLGYPEVHRKPWISDYTWKKIEGRKQLKQQLLQCQTHTTRYDELRLSYTNLRKEIKKSVRKDKRSWADGIATEAQQAANANNMRDMYKLSRLLANKGHAKEKPIRSKTGELLATENQQLLRWHEYFKEVLEKQPDIIYDQQQQQENHGNTLNIRITPPSLAEVTKAISSLKNNKAPGVDNIEGEMLKADVSGTAKQILPLIQKIWETEEFPVDWKQGLLIKLPKKGDLSRCSNWRGITLLSVVSKVLCKVLLTRMTSVMEPLLRQEQAGFRPEKSCVDNINTLRLITEQAEEFKSTLYMVFVDFEKAFDTLNWQYLWDTLANKGVPKKIISLIKSSYTDFKCRVVHQSQLSDTISVVSGVRQGCLLSPFLFIVTLDNIMCKATRNRPRGIQWGPFHRLEDIDYADDICLLSHTHADMAMKLGALQEEARIAGLRINVPKTKDIRIRARNQTAFEINGTKIETVNEFCYLGSIIAESGGADADVESRIRKAKGAFALLNSVWKSSVLSRNLKLRIFNSNVKSVLLYGCETWKVTASLTNKIQVFINGCLRKILRIYWPETISNVDLWSVSTQKPIDEEVRRRKWNWIGHVLRRSDTNIAKQSLTYNPQGRRRRGRPKQTWKRTVEAEIKEIGKTWEEIRVLSRNRVRWRFVVDALCPTRG